MLSGSQPATRTFVRHALVRLLHYDTLDTLLEDDELIVEIALAAPTEKGRHG